MHKNHLYLILGLGFRFNFGEEFVYFREKVFKYFKNLLQNSKFRAKSKQSTSSRTNIKSHI